MNQYKMTLKRQAFPRHISHLEAFLVAFREKYPAVRVEEYWEYDPSDIIHFHALVTSRRKLYLKNIRTLLDNQTDYHFNLQELDGEDAVRLWLMYCKKNRHKQTQAINKEHELERMYTKIFEWDPREDE